MHSWECAAPIWSCCFNTDNPLYFYAGLANGQVLLFDKRKIDSHVLVINAANNNGSPVVSLSYASTRGAGGNENSAMSFRSAGLIVATLDKVTFFERLRNDEEYRYAPLLLESGIMSCYLEPATRHVLVSTRPSSRHATVRHLVYEFTMSANAEGVAAASGDNNSHALNLLQCFNGSSVQKLLAKSKLFCVSGQLCGAAPCEATKSVMVWDVAGNQLLTRLPCASDVIDVCPIQRRETSFMCSLSDKQLKLFKKN
jgi:E3 ubiquitin-protein ligase RFWD3